MPTHRVVVENENVKGGLGAVRGASVLCVFLTRHLLGFVMQREEGGRGHAATPAEATCRAPS